MPTYFPRKTMHEKIFIELYRNTLLVLKVYEVREVNNELLLVRETDDNESYSMFSETIMEDEIYKIYHDGVIMVVQGSSSEAFKKLHDYTSENMREDVESKLTESLPKIRTFLNMMHRDNDFVGFKLVFRFGEGLESVYIKNKRHNDGNWTSVPL